MVMADVAILRAACCVAGLDDEICGREHPLLLKLAEKAGVGSASLNAMIDMAKNDENYYKDQFRVYSSEPEKTIRMLLVVAASDGTIEQSERVIIGHFAEKLGMSSERYKELLKVAEERAAKEAGEGA